MRTVLTVRDASKRMGKSRSQLYQDVKDRLLPPPIVGEEHFGWYEDEIEAVLRAQDRGESDETIRALVTQLIGNRHKE